MGSFRRDLVTSDLTDEIENSEHFLNIGDASKADMWVKALNSREKTTLEILKSKLVVGLGKEISRGEDNPIGDHHKSEPPTGFTHNHGTQKGEHWRKLDEAAPTNLQRCPPLSDGNIEIVTVHGRDGLNFHVLVWHGEASAGPSTPLVADEALHEVGV